jgi:hypothetical protein
MVLNHCTHTNWTIPKLLHTYGSLNFRWTVNGWIFLFYFVCLFVCLFLFFPDRVFLCGPGCPGSHLGVGVGVGCQAYLKLIQILFWSLCWSPIPLLPVVFIQVKKKKKKKRRRRRNLEGCVGYIAKKFGVYCSIPSF